MVTKLCPKCQQQVPVACKACPCGHIFFAARRPISIHKLGESREGTEEVKCRRTERVRRERPDYFNALQIENQLKSLQRKARQRGGNSTSSSTNDNEGEGYNSEGSTTSGAHQPKKRGRPKGSGSKKEKRDKIEKPEVIKGGLQVVCYFPNWAGYRKGDGAHTPTDIDANLCTHVNYAFAVLDAQTFKIKAFDSWADIDKGFYQQTVDLKKKNPNLKVLIAIGGWTDSAGSKYSNLVANPSRRREFITDLIGFLKKYKFDGLDLDWEYPSCPQNECGGSRVDRENFAVFAQELRAAFDKESPRFLLSAAVAANKNTIDNAYNVPVLASALDYINVMCYDYHGPWESTTGQNAPFKPYAGSDPTLTVEATMKYWMQKGAPAKKLIMGIPAYGKSFTLSNPSNNGFNAPRTGAGTAGQFTGEPGLLAYYEICSSIKNDGWTKVTDPNAGPYAYKGNQWTGYDDPKTAEMKARYVKENNFGGAMVWDVAMDDFHGKCCNVKNPILQAINYGLFGKGVSASSMSCA